MSECGDGHLVQRDQEKEEHQQTSNNGVAASSELLPRPSTTQRRGSAMPGVPPRSQVSKREMRLFIQVGYATQSISTPIQFFVVSLIFLTTWTTWQWLPRVTDNISPYVTKWIYFTLTTFFFINNAVNPTVYLIFNSTLRREVGGLGIAHAWRRMCVGAGNVLRMSTHVYIAMCGE